MTKEAQIQSLTKKEKASFMRGKDNWNTMGSIKAGIESVLMSDGPIGVRKVKEDENLSTDSQVSVCYPCGALVASSFDEKIAALLGRTLGEEAKNYGIQVLLGPAMNIKRSPSGGRGFEYYSEDPYLTGLIATYYVNALQEQGIGASIKHFALNSQETNRFTINEIIDERTLNEIYLKAFKMVCINAHPATVMMSYNKINQVHSTENSYLMQKKLREEWNYRGVTISDWGAVYDPAESLWNGLDIEMPHDGNVNYPSTLVALYERKGFEEKTDQAISRMIDLSTMYPKRKQTEYDFKAHHATAVRIAEESIVLLRNEEHMLPLQKADTLCVIGDFAHHPRYQGGGSSHINPYLVDDFTSFLDQDKYAYCEGYHLDGREEERLLQEAVQNAQKCSKVILFLGIPEEKESEGFDRDDLRLPSNQLKLIDKVCEVNPNIIVILMNGGPVEMPFLKKAKAIIETYLGGEGVNKALFHILYGIKNPSGHLAETFPLKLEDNPSYPYFPGDGFDVCYQESLFVGYRYYKTYHVKTLFPFGFGLSYSEFTYSGLKIEHRENGAVSLSCKVKNISDIPGKCCVQFYVSKPKDMVFNPSLELCGFVSVYLNPKEERNVETLLKPEENVFEYFNIHQHRFVPLFGKYVFSIGSDADHLLESKEFDYPGINEDVPYDSKELPSYYQNGDLMSVSEEEYARLFSTPILRTDRNAPFTLDTSFRQASMKGSKGAKMILNFVNRISFVKENRIVREHVENGPIRLFLYQVPFLGGKNTYHIFAILNDRHIVYHLFCLLLIVLKNRKRINVG